MFLKSCASLIFFRADFLPGRVKDLSAPRVEHYSGDDGKLSPLTRPMGIPCLISEPLSAVAIYGSYVRLYILTTPDLKL